jgi:hypothetical protein
MEEHSQEAIEDRSHGRTRSNEATEILWDASPFLCVFVYTVAPDSAPPPSGCTTFLSSVSQTATACG